MIWDESGDERQFDDHDAQDVLADTFAAFFKTVGTFQCKSKLFTWLYRIAINKSMDFYRKKYRQPLAQSVPLKHSIPVADEENVSDPDGNHAIEECDQLYDDVRLEPKKFRLTQENRAIAAQEMTRWISQSDDPADHIRDPKFNLRIALKSISELQSSVFTLRVQERRTIKETAAILGITPGSVKMAQKRGLEHLANKLRAFNPSEAVQP